MVVVEIWANIPNASPGYMVSTLGRVKRIYESGNTKILKLFQGHYGYMQVRLSTDGKTKAFLVHRLVGQAFLANPARKREINHIDENKQNNCVENLEWVTHQENLRKYWDKRASIQDPAKYRKEYYERNKHNPEYKALRNKHSNLYYYRRKERLAISSH